MAAGHAHDALLDQLQAQVNLVLAQTGRVFAAVNANPQTPPTAQVDELRHTLPLATSRFHDALHRLESELHLAQCVLRRDLALCREEQAGRPPRTVVPAAARVPDEARGNEAEAEAASGKPGVLGPAPAQAQDPHVPMQEDAEDQKPTAVPSAATPVRLADPVPPPAAPPAEPSADALDVDAETPPPPADTTATDKPPEDVKPRDPAATDDAPASLANDFAFDADADATAGEMDFGGFGNHFGADGNDNDNISSLLPGLEDYANTQSTSNAELDLNALFPTAGPDGQNPRGAPVPGAGEQRDTTFDDLMDLANFDGTGLDEGNSNHADLDFDSLFN